MPSNNPKAPTVVYHILVDHKYEAEDLLKKIESGSDFHEIAKKFSKCSSAKVGGDLGPFKPGRFVQEFEEALEVLKPGQISPPTRTRFGYHLIKIK